MSSIPQLAPKKSDHFHAESDTCPTCEQPIAAEQRAQVWKKIRLKQREEQAARDVELRRVVAEAVKSATDLQGQQHVLALGRLQKQLVDKDEEAKKREQAARAQALVEARTQHDLAMKRVHEKQAAAEEKTKDLMERIAQIEAGRTKDIEKAVAREVGKVRELMTKDKDDTLNKTNAKHFDEMQKLQTKLQEAQRQLDKERADSLGEGQEVDIYNDLREAFPKDDISRIEKGEAGADIRHQIVHKGEVCGTFLYESKNRMRWSKEYAAKLRRDQVADKADHAILASVKFPSGFQEFALIEGVIVVNPRRVVAIAKFLREITISMHKLRLSAEERGKKREELYQFFTSPRCHQLLTRQEEVAAALLEIEKKELKQHEKIWNERGTTIKQLEKAQADFRGAVEGILEG